MDYTDKNMNYSTAELTGWVMQDLRATADEVQSIATGDPLKRLFRLGCTLGMCAEKETDPSRRKMLFAAIKKITELEMGIDEIMARAIGCPSTPQSIAGTVAQYLTSLDQKQGGAH